MPSRVGGHRSAPATVPRSMTQLFLAVSRCGLTMASALHRPVGIDLDIGVIVRHQRVIRLSGDCGRGARHRLHHGLVSRMVVQPSPPVATRPRIDSAQQIFDLCRRNVQLGYA